MRNLFLLLWRYQYFLFFLLFESLCGFLLIRGNDFQRASFLNTASEVAATVLSGVNKVTQYIGLTEESRRLAQENAMLHGLLPNAYYDDRMVLGTVQDSLLRLRYTYLEARVINNTTGHRNNYLTLNAGARKGVTKDMSVISASGIVGVIRDVSENFCTVISVLHKDFKTTARLRQNNFYGNLEWTGGNPRFARLKDMPKHVVLHKGDTLVTTTFSSVFPEGVMVGTISDFDLPSGANFYDISVELATDFSNLNYVYIVKDIFRDELNELESKKKPDDK